jgi:CheY-like chemotaxis protein
LPTPGECLAAQGPGLAGGDSMEVPALNRPEPRAALAGEAVRVLGKHILLVEDQQSVRIAVKLLLSFDEHTVVEAADGVEALSLFSSDHFDLVVTDLEMPRMKGNELARRIKRISPSQRVLMITAYAEEFGQSKNPVDLILNKPFAFEDLRRAIAALFA